MKKLDPTQPATLRNLALSHLDYLTKAEEAKNPRLSHGEAFMLAVSSPGGREAHRLHNLPGSEKPFDQAIEQIVKAELAKAETSPKKTISPWTEATLIAKRQQLAKLGTSESRARLTVGPTNPTPAVFPVVGQPPTTPAVKPTDYPSFRPAPTSGKRPNDALAEKLPAQPAGSKITAPISPADMLLTAMHEQAQAAFPDLSPAQSFVKFMSTEAGAELHRQYQAHHAAQAARGK